MGDAPRYVMTGIKLGELVGISERRVRELRDAGVIPDNGRGKYALPDAVQAYCARLREQAAGRQGDDGESGLVNERARLAKEQADRIEMENEVRRGELLIRGDVDAAVTSAFARVRSRLLAIPVKAAAMAVQAASPAEAEAVIRAAIIDVLGELAETDVEKLGGDDQNVVAGADAAARPLDQRVG